MPPTQQPLLDRTVLTVSRSQQLFFKMGIPNMLFTTRDYLRYPPGILLVQILSAKDVF